LNQLYITTARTGQDDDALKDQPHAGGLFLARPGVRGVPSAAYAG
jgi:L-arabinonolactonase